MINWVRHDRVYVKRRVRQTGLFVHEGIIREGVVGKWIIGERIIHKRIVAVSLIDQGVKFTSKVTTRIGNELRLSGKRIIENSLNGINGFIASV